MKKRFSCYFILSLKCCLFFRMFFFSVTKSQRMQREMNTKMLFQFISKRKLFKNKHRRKDVQFKYKNFHTQNLFQQNLINSNLIRIIR